MSFVCCWLFLAFWLNCFNLLIILTVFICLYIHTFLILIELISYQIWLNLKTKKVYNQDVNLNCVSIYICVNIYAKIYWNDKKDAIKIFFFFVNLYDYILHLYVFSLHCFHWLSQLVAPESRHALLM